MAVSLVLLLLFVFNGADASHIVGGRDAASHSHPYMASFQVYGQHLCGGALVREDFVVTAANCQVSGRLTVVVGTDSLRGNEATRQEIRVASLIPHPLYDPVRIRNNIMLVKLRNRAQLTEEVQLIPLKAERITAASRCLTAGWGTIDDDNTLPVRLQEVNVTTLSEEECRRRWGQAAITSSMVCGVGGRAFQGFCSGDSGGPLVCDGETAGVVSFSGRRCGDPRTPDVYARMSSFRDWITSVINNS